MRVEIGNVEAIFRYPVKSMAGEPLDVANLGWHGLEGDRRLALRRIDDRSGFPWLTASKFPDLIRFAPQRHEHGAHGDLPTHVRTPEGKLFELFGEELCKDVTGRYGAPVEMMHLRNGIFDDACISMIACETVDEIANLAGVAPAARRFRPNLLLRLSHAGPFQEDAWLGSVLLFGEEHDAPAVSVTMRDLRCAMVNLDPDSPALSPQVMKAVVRANQNYAGVYGAVTRTGRIAVGQRVFVASSNFTKPLTNVPA